MTKDCKEVFTEIYRSKVWGDGSGGGSAPDVARPYIDFITGFVNAPNRIYTVLDIGCGDLVVANLINWGMAHYIGVDVHSYYLKDIGKHMLFLACRDVLTDPLPAADLILCKEVMQHLSNEQVQLLLDRTAHYQRRLFTNSKPGPEVTENEDIDTGGFRPVDLSLPPFNQPCKTVLEYGCWHVQELRR